MKKLIFLLVLVATVGGAGTWYWHTNSQPRSNFRTAKVFHGPLRATIGATGTLEPEEVVDIGAQVAGRIEFLGQDPGDSKKVINWGSVVEQGTVLAQLDKSLYKAQVESSEADLKRTKADLLQKKAQLEQATADWKRAQDLYPKQGISQAEFDQYKAGFEIAKANVEVSTAQIGAASGKLALDKTNLEYTTITSPVKGVIIDRRINVGQTVVASLSAPSLFLLAKDLSKMEVWATVNEADVGKIYIGQPVVFTVDAYPGEVFKGTVKPQGAYANRLNATMNQNVVTFTVVVSADNSPSPGHPMGKLLPYLTTNLSFIVSDKSDTLLVPNAALRWSPSRRQIHPDVRDAYGKLRGKKRSITDVEAEHAFLWWVDEGFVKFTQVRIGPSDGANTEILGVVGGGELPEGTELVIGEGRTVEQDSGNGPNPFAPAIFKKAAKKEP